MMKKGIKYLIATIFFLFIGHILIITFEGLNDNIEFSEVAVVLGNKVELDGRPSKRLQGRLDRAVELYKKEYFNYVIVSGGIGKAGFNEAVIMKPISD